MFPIIFSCTNTHHIWSVCIRKTYIRYKHLLVASHSLRTSYNQLIPRKKVICHSSNDSECPLNVYEILTIKRCVYVRSWWKWPCAGRSCVNAKRKLLYMPYLNGQTSNVVTNQLWVWMSHVWHHTPMRIVGMAKTSHKNIGKPYSSYDFLGKHVPCKKAQPVWMLQLPIATTRLDVTQKQYSLLPTTMSSDGLIHLSNKRRWRHHL